MVIRHNLAKNATVAASATGASQNIPYVNMGVTLVILANCSVAGATTTLAYKVETSPDGTNWYTIGATPVMQTGTLVTQLRIVNILEGFVRVSPVLTGANQFTGVNADLIIG